MEKGNSNNSMQILKLPNKEIVLDIPTDQQPPFDKPRPLFRLNNLKDFYSNQLFTKTNDHLVKAIKNESNLKGIDFSDPLISCVYIRDQDNSWDLLLEFFMQVKGTTNFFFFEAEINTSLKSVSDSFAPKIYKCICFKIQEEVQKPEMLSDIASGCLNAYDGGKYSDYEVLDIISAKHLFDYKFLNPEHYIISCYVRDASHNQLIALMSLSIEEESSEPLTAKIDFFKTTIDFFKISNDLSFEIFTPEKIKDSFHLKGALDYIKSKKLLGELPFGKELIDILSGLSLKQPKKDYLEIILNFIHHPKVVHQVHLTCYRKEEQLTFNIIKHEKFFMTPNVCHLNKKRPSTDELLSTLKKFVSIDKKMDRYNYVTKINKITSSYCVINDGLIFPECWEVTFSGEITKGISTKPINLIMNYAIHDFDEETIPVSLIELDSKGNIFVPEYLILQNDYLLQYSNSNLIKNKSKLIYEMPSESNVSANLKKLVENYIPYIKKEFKEKVITLQLNDKSPSNIIHTTLKAYIDCNDLTCIVQMGLKNLNQDVYNEITIRINNIIELKSEVVSLKTYVLKPLDESEYLPYEVLTTIIWGNSMNMSFIGFEIVKMKRSCILENSPFKYIYYLEFNSGISTTNQKIIFGEKKDNVFVVLVPISYCVGNNN